MNVQRGWVEPRRVRLTVEQFLLLADSFADAPKVELVEGVIVATNAQPTRHARVKSRLFRVLAEAVERVMPGYEALTEASVAIPPDSVPEPDIVVTSFAGGREAVPVATAALVVEVADASLRHDLHRKPRLYARGVPEYWVVDVEGGALHRFRRRGPEGYAERDEAALGVVVEAATVAGLAVVDGRAGVMARKAWIGAISALSS